MPSAYTDAVRKTTALVLARSNFLVEKKPSASSMSISEQLGQRTGTGFASLTTDARNQRAYGYFRGWVYSVIHAVARRVATQPWGIGITGAASPQEEGERKRRGAQRKNLMAKLKRWDCVKAIADTSDMELLTEHPLLTLLNRPNTLQRKWDFLYLSAVNMMLTGECYWIASMDEDGVTEFWCVPTHWITPKHNGGMFTSYILSIDSVTKIELPAEAVARTYTPSPSDLRQAMSPLQAVISSVQIDDAIVDSQQQMFQRGIFPNLIVTVGKVLGADGKLTDRRWGLTMAQRSQVIRAIRQIWSQSVNAGDPAILDGMIESVHKLNSTSQEMDWLTSGEMVRKRVMMAFGVNEIALGDVQHANRASAVVAEQSICATSVNPLVAAFSESASVFFSPKYDKAGKLVVWLEPSEPIDPDLELSRWTAARTVGDVTRTEFRNEVLGLPPLEDEVEQYRNPLMESVGGMQGAVQVLTGVSQGMIEPDAASKLLQLFLQIPKKDADEIAGVGKEPKEPAPVPQQEPPPQQPTEEEPTQEEEGVGIEELGEEPGKGRKYSDDQPRDESGRWADEGGESSRGGGESEVREPNDKPAEPPPTRTRKESLAEAEKQGFRPSSRDKWINEQQAIEFLENKESKEIVEQAKTNGFAPTSSDEFINEMQARDYLRENGEHKADLNEKDPAIAVVIETAKKEDYRIPHVQKFIQAQLQKDGAFKEKAFSNFGAVKSLVGKWFGKNVGGEVKPKVTKFLDSFFTADKLVGRIWASVIGEPWKQAKSIGKVEFVIKQVQRLNSLGLTRDDIKAVKADQTAKVQKEVGRVAARYFQDLRGICGGGSAEVRQDDGRGGAEAGT